MEHQQGLTIHLREVPKKQALNLQKVNCLGLFITTTIMNQA